MDERLARELVKSRKAVKQKYQSLKNAEFETKTKLEETYRPITEPLQKLVSTFGKIEPADVGEEFQSPIKKMYESSTSPKHSFVDISPPGRNIFASTSTPQKSKKTGKTPNLPHETPSFFHSDLTTTQVPSFLRTSIIAETTDSSHGSEITPHNLSDILEQTKQTITTFINTEAYSNWLDQFDRLPRQYIDAGVRDTEHKFDHQYGIVHDYENEKFYLGLTQIPVQIIGKDIQIGEVKYSGTPGLYELLFKKEPTGYTQKDLDNYMDILKRTNAYRRNYNPDEQVQGNASHKYITIIGPYLQRKGVTKTRNINPIQNLFQGVMAQGQRQTRSNKPPHTGGSLSLKINKPNTDYVYWNDVNELVDRLRLLVTSTIAGHTGHNNEIISIIEELKEANIII